MKKKNARHAKPSKVKLSSAEKQNLTMHESDHVESQDNSFEDEWNPTDEWGFETELL